MFLRDKKKELKVKDLESAISNPNLKEDMSLSHLDPDLSERVLSQMPNGYRKVFSLVIFKGYSHDEVSQKLGISAETSRSQLARSKKWLRQHFSNNKTLMQNGF